jgi:2-polyprenyl-3-methyl-5-hydroxy-6-metoxy-1,4-benzoquinol methylase
MLDKKHQEAHEDQQDSYGSNAGTSTSGIEYYESVYYGAQTIGRGARTNEQLLFLFQKLVSHYDELLGPLLPNSPTTRCLDLACGYGNWLHYLRSKGYGLIEGVDSDPEQVRLAQMLKLPARVGDVHDVLQGNGEYDIISALDLIEHLEKNNAVRLLQAVLAALRPGGMLIIRTPCADGFAGSRDIFNDLTHRWGATSNVIRQLLRTIGFANVILLDESAPRYPKTLRRLGLISLRRIVRKFISFGLRVAGVPVPRIWSPSQMVVAQKPKEVTTQLPCC